MKKLYKTPIFKTRKIEPIEIICTSDNGKHKGWNNPHNPHYPGTQSFLDEEE